MENSLPKESKTSKDNFQKSTDKQHKIIRYVFFGLCVVYTIAAVGWFFYSPQSSPQEKRARHYLTPERMIDELKRVDNGKDKIGNGVLIDKPELTPEEKAAIRLQVIFDGKLAYYQTKVTQFYVGITFTLVLTILAIVVLLLPDGDIMVPGFPEIKIPNYISYLVIPVCLCYGWIQFGFHLHHIIEVRMALINLIDTQFFLFHTDTDCSIDCGNALWECTEHLCHMIDGVKTINYKYYYSATRATDLKDTGFLDSWFLIFFPDYFPTAPLKTIDKSVVAGPMVAIGMLYGIAQGLQLGLILNWRSRFWKISEDNKIVQLLPALLFFILAVFLAFSHFGFYKTGNRNWLQIIIIAFAAAAFWFVTNPKLRDYHQKITDAKKEKEAGKFILKKLSRDKYQFHLETENNQIILTSDEYSSRPGALNGIKSVRKNALNDRRYQRRQMEDGNPFFTLKASNGEHLGSSGIYSTIAAMENAIEGMKKHASVATIEDDEE